MLFKCFQSGDWTQLKCVYVCVCVYRLRCSSRVRKVMRLGSGRERRRCIMQFSLAAGSDRAARNNNNRFSHNISSSCLSPSPCKISKMADWWLSLAWGHTYALHEGGVESVGEQRLRQLPEVQLERSCDGVNVHVAQHHQDVFGIYGSDRVIKDGSQNCIPASPQHSCSRSAPSLQETGADELKVT